MTLVILLSTMSFTVSMHYCEGELIDTAIFQKAHSCGMDMGDESTMKKNGCCDDKEIHIEGQDELTLPIADLNTDQEYLVISFVQSYIHLFQAVEYRNNTFSDYPPPTFIVRQIFKLDETYLI